MNSYSRFILCHNVTAQTLADKGWETKGTTLYAPPPPTFTAAHDKLLSIVLSVCRDQGRRRNNRTDDPSPPPPSPLPEPQDTPAAYPVPDQCWPNITDHGAALKQHKGNVSYLVGTPSGTLRSLCGHWFLSCYIGPAIVQYCDIWAMYVFAMWRCEQGNARIYCVGVSR